MSHITNPQQSPGNKREVIVGDDENRDLLNEIIEQLKIMNLHLSLITDNNIGKTEVE